MSKIHKFSEYCIKSILPIKKNTWVWSTTIYFFFAKGKIKYILNWKNHNPRDLENGLITMYSNWFVHQYVVLLLHENKIFSTLPYISNYPTLQILTWCFSVIFIMPDSKLQAENNLQLKRLADYLSTTNDTSNTSPWITIPEI